MQIPFSSYDLTDANPSSLSKPDQSLFMKIVGYLFSCQLSIPIYEISYSTSIKTCQAYLSLYFPYKRSQFNGNAALQFHAFVDSSYASHSDRTSQFGVSIHINYLSGSCISISKKRNYWLSLLLKRNI